MGNFRKNVKKASMARGSVDKAQNQLMKRMNKKLDSLETAVETKYNVQSRSDSINSYDGSTVVTRADQIIELDIGVNQGTSDIERIGDQVTFKHLDFNYRLALPFMSTGEYGQNVNTVRILLFWDSQPSAISGAGGTVVNPVYWPQLLQECKIGVTLDAQKKQVLLSQKDWDQRKRFQIFYDKVHTLSAGGDTDAAANTSGLGARSATNVISFSKTYVGQKIRYIAGGTIVANRKLYFAYISDAGIPTGILPAPIVVPRKVNIDYNFRLFYDDI